MRTTTNGRTGKVTSAERAKSSSKHYPRKNFALADWHPLNFTSYSAAVVPFSKRPLKIQTRLNNRYNFRGALRGLRQVVVVDCSAVLAPELCY
jgi:hypothetical protein